MKLSLTLLLSLLLSGVAIAQDRGQNVPENVKRSFLSDFPDAQRIYWQKQASRYVIDFVLNGYDQEAHYSGTGTWHFTEITVPESMMPRNAMAHCWNRYPGAMLLSTGYHDEENNRYYRVEIRYQGRTIQLQYDDDGNFIRD